MKDDQQKGGLTLTPTERTAVAENHQATQLAPILGLTEEELKFAIEYTCGAFMGNQQRSYQAAFPEVGANYASTRSSELLKRERVVAYVKMVSVALVERLIQHSGGVERLEDWRTDAQEAKSLLKAARRRQIRLSSVESTNLIYVINRALGTPTLISDHTNRDEASTLQALERFARRVQEERRQKLEAPG